MEVEGCMRSKQNRANRTDEVIKQEVEEKLFKAYAVDASAIEVSVQQGVVVLTGSVPSHEEVLAAKRCIDQIMGVVAIENELVVSHFKDRPLSKTGFETGFS